MVIEGDHDAADSQATSRFMGILWHVAGAGERDIFNPDLRKFPPPGSVMTEGDRRVFFAKPAERSPEFMRRLAAAATATMPLGEWSGEPSPEAVRRAERHREIGAAWRYRGYRGLDISEMPTRLLRPVEPATVAPESGQSRPSRAPEPPTELLPPVATPDAPTLVTAAIPGGLEYSTGVGAVRGILVEQPPKQE